MQPKRFRVEIHVKTTVAAQDLAEVVPRLLEQIGPDNRDVERWLVKNASIQEVK